MTRPENWPSLLAAFVDAYSRTPFEWGVNDCCLFAADWVRALHGRDVAEAFRGRYATKIGASRLVHKAGGVKALIDATLASSGFSQVDPRLAGRGDIVFSTEAAGVCLGPRILFAGGATRPMTTAEAAWRV